MASRSARRHAGHEEHENHERWLVSYADFITLLFAFFTVLYATSQQDAEKARQFEQSIRKFFGAMVVGTQNSGESHSYDQSRNFIEPMLPNFPQARKGNLQIEEYVDQYLKKNLTPAEYQTLGIEVLSDSEGVRIRLSTQNLFNRGGAVISSALTSTLDKIAGLLKRTTRSISIEGHANESNAANWELSSMRATKMVRYFIERAGVPAGQLSSRAFGNQRPLADTPQLGAEANSRIEIVISNQATDEAP